MSFSFVRSPGIVARRRLLMAAAGTALLGLAACSRDTPAPLHGADLSGGRMGMDFRLQGPQGRTVALSDFHGQAVLVFFGFTQCPDICPTALARAAQVKQLLGQDAGRLAVLFVTLDPARDTPAILQAYTEAFDPAFVGLTGTQAQIDEIAAAFKVFYMKVPAGDSYTIDHTTFSYLYDPQGRLRVGLRHEQTARQYAEDVRQLL